MKNKIAVIINVIILIIIAIMIILLVSKFYSTQPIAGEKCEETNIKLDYNACFDYFTNSTLLSITRGIDNYKITGINISFIENKKFTILDIPEKNETKRYKFEFDKNPKKILAYYYSSENICIDEKIVVIDYCSSAESVFANFSITKESPGIIPSEMVPSPTKSDILPPSLTSGRWKTTCKSEWMCGEWEACQKGIQKRGCKDKKSCLIPTDIPDFTRNCEEECKEDWRCEWSECINGYTTPKCKDMNGCGTYYFKPGQLGCIIKSEKECIPEIVCDDWSECKVNYNLNELVKGIENVKGIHSRKCMDVKRCIYTITETGECSLNTDIYAKKIEWCGKSYLGIFDKLNNELLAKVDYTKNQFNINLRQNKEYCEHCYNYIKDEDEEKVDCGGSCKPC
ncbi:hypothetical protein FJZ19_04340 [Candidatus Pacearchaeota archaeon]|nr:hypothetical protein [Candidatus Pacearchaeota archaeon]